MLSDAGHAFLAQTAERELWTPYQDEHGWHVMTDRGPAWYSDSKFDINSAKMFAERVRQQRPEDRCFHVRPNGFDGVIALYRDAPILPQYAPKPDPETQKRVEFLTWMRCVNVGWLRALPSSGPYRSDVNGPPFTAPWLAAQEAGHIFYDAMGATWRVTPAGHDWLREHGGTAAQVREAMTAAGITGIDLATGSDRTGIVTLGYDGSIKAWRGTWGKNGRGLESHGLMPADTWGQTTNAKLGEWVETAMIDLTRVVVAATQRESSEYPSKAIVEAGKRIMKEALEAMRPAVFGFVDDPLPAKLASSDLDRAMKKTWFAVFPYPASGFAVMLPCGDLRLFPTREDADAWVSRKRPAWEADQERARIAAAPKPLPVYRGPLLTQASQDDVRVKYISAKPE